MSVTAAAKTAAESIKKVGVVGAGVIGASWATFFLSKNIQVVVVDPNPQARDLVESMLVDAEKAYSNAGLGAKFQYDPRNLVVSDDYTSLKGVHFVQENGPERPEIKSSIYRLVEANIARDVAIASSSSGIVPSVLQQHATHPDRVLLAHPFNPPHIVPLVEVIGGKHTDPKYVDLTYAFYKLLGKAPILIKKEVKGHVANRLQAAIAQEVIHLLNEDVASLEDLDIAMSQGPGLRWGIFGQFVNLELGGGQGGLRHMLEHLGPAMLDWAHDLGRVDKLTPEILDKVSKGVDDFHARTQTTPSELAAVRDRLLIQNIHKKEEEFHKIKLD